MWSLQKISWQASHLMGRKSATQSTRFVIWVKVSSIKKKLVTHFHVFSRLDSPKRLQVFSLQCSPRSGNSIAEMSSECDSDETNLEEKQDVYMTHRLSAAEISQVIVTLKSCNNFIQTLITHTARVSSEPWLIVSSRCFVDRVNSWKLKNSDFTAGPPPLAELS